MLDGHRKVLPENTGGGNAGDRYGAVVSGDLRTDLIAHIPWVDGHADVWRAFSDKELFRRLVAALADPFRAERITKVAGIEARGFIVGGAVAVELNAGFVAIRKGTGLFPGPKIERTAPYDYRGQTAVLRLQRTSLGPADLDFWSTTGSRQAARRSRHAR
jgi:adenine phosphoribosyltransferase